MEMYYGNLVLCGIQLLVIIITIILSIRLLHKIKKTKKQLEDELRSIEIKERDIEMEQKYGPKAIEDPFDSVRRYHNLLDTKTGGI